MPWIETIDDPRRAGRKIAYEPWMTRWVMWVYARNSMHVATTAACIGHGIVTRLACGHTGGGCELRGSTWFYVRGHSRRLCSRCVRALAAAGESGRIEPPPS